MFEQLRVKIQNLIMRGRVDRPGVKLQLIGSNGGTFPETEYMQPQGVDFAPPADAQGVILAPNGQTSAAVALCQSGDTPSDTKLPGEGGLHYLGTFKVYLNLDGTLSLGEKSPADWVALASKADANWTALRDAVSDALTAVGAGAAADGPGAAASFDLATTGLAAPPSVASDKVRCS